MALPPPTDVSRSRMTTVDVNITSTNNNNNNNNNNNKDKDIAKASVDSAISHKDSSFPHQLTVATKSGHNSLFSVTNILSPPAVDETGRRPRKSPVSTMSTPTSNDYAIGAVGVGSTGIGSSAVSAAGIGASSAVHPYQSFFGPNGYQHQPTASDFTTYQNAAASWNSPFGISRFQPHPAMIAGMMDPTKAAAHGISFSMSHQRRKRRVLFTQHQVCALEHKFKSQRYLTAPEREQMSQMTGLSATQIKIWFQNHRYKCKRQLKEKQMQERRPVTDDQSPSSSPVNATQQYGNNAAMANVGCSPHKKMAVSVLVKDGKPCGDHSPLGTPDGSSTPSDDNHHQQQQQLQQHMMAIGQQHQMLGHQLTTSPLPTDISKGSNNHHHQQHQLMYQMQPSAAHHMGPTPAAAGYGSSAGGQYSTVPTFQPSPFGSPYSSQFHQYYGPMGHF